MHSLLNNQLFEDALLANKAKGVAETAKTIFIEAAKGLSKAINRNKLGDEALEIFLL